ncbi:MAG: glycosyltransferase family 4 protein [Phototrophicaceae bacterium]
MSKNILFTSWYTGLGGGETDLLSLAECLNPDEWTLHLLLPAEGVLAQKWREYGWTVHIIKYRGASTFFVPAIWAKFPVVQKMKTLLQAHQIDLVVSEYHTLPMIHPATQALNIPIMWTVHGWWFKPKFWQINFFKTIPLVARSYSIREGFLGEPPFINPETVPVIYSGVDTDRFRPNEDAYIRERFQLGFAQDTPLVVMVARFQSVKGHHIFQAMVQQVALQIPHAKFVVAGEDTFGVTKDEVYRNEMLENVQTDPLLKTRLHYIGFRDDVENLLAAADVVVCASEFESYGKVNIEAMATATPVVSTNQGGPSETIIHNETGYLVPANDAQAFATQVIRLLKNPEERQRLGANGRRYVKGKFSAKTTSESYNAIFKKLL